MSERSPRPGKITVITESNLCETSHMQLLVFKDFKYNMLQINKNFKLHCEQSNPCFFRWLFIIVGHGQEWSFRLLTDNFAVSSDKIQAWLVFLQRIIAKLEAPVGCSEVVGKGMKQDRQDRFSVTSPPCCFFMKHSFFLISGRWNTALWLAKIYHVTSALYTGAATTKFSKWPSFCVYFHVFQPNLLQYSLENQMFPSSC